MQHSLSKSFGLIDATLVRFGLVGVINTTIDVLGFLLLATVFGLIAPIANAAAYSLGILSSYTLNSRWTFSQRIDTQQHYRRFGLFLLVNAAGLILSTCLVVSFLTVMDEFAAKVLSVPIVFIWNFLAAKYFVFDAKGVEIEGGSANAAKQDGPPLMEGGYVGLQPEQGVSIDGIKIATMMKIHAEGRGANDVRHRARHVVQASLGPSPRGSDLPPDEQPVIRRAS